MCVAGMGMLLAGGPAEATAAFRVQFTQNEYVLNSPTERFLVQVVIDADAVRPGNQPVPSGLLSMGVRITPEAAKAKVANAGEISIVPALDSDGGFGPGARAVNTFVGSATAKGFVPLIDPPYAGTSLVSFWVTGVSSAMPYNLSLSLFREAPTESVFVTGGGQVIDEQIVFGTARVTLIPEPAALGVLPAAVLPLLRRRRR